MDDDTLDLLTGDLVKLAEVVGVDNALKAAQRFLGDLCHERWAKGPKRARRDWRIRKLYDAGQFTLRPLALGFEHGDRKISNILKRPN